MNTKLYVGNLSFDVSESTLKELFEKHGTVVEVALISDKFTGRSRGFGFVTMESAEAAQAAIEKLDGQSLDGRNLTVNEARPKTDSGGRFSGGGRREKSKSRY
jgi:cold-inducible RNA-binding protein